MRSLRAFLAVLVLLLSTAGAALAADKCAEHQKAGAAGPHEVAVFSIPKLEKASVIKQLAKALADKPGILQAQRDPEKKTFNVIFDKEQTSPDQILESVSAVSKEAKLVDVRAADGKDLSKCGGCPSAKKCPSAKGK
jgi:hypothetical protein